MVRLGDEMTPEQVARFNEYVKECMRQGKWQLPTVPDLTPYELFALVSLHGLLACAGDKCEWGEVTEAACSVADAFCAALDKRKVHS